LKRAILRRGTKSGEPVDQSRAKKIPAKKLAYVAPCKEPKADAIHPAAAAAAAKHVK
jgi:hypothetical protein